MKRETHGAPWLFVLLLCVPISTWAQDSSPSEFRTVIRQGSVDLEKEYNLTDLAIPMDEIHRLLPRDAIPALTDPPREPPRVASWLDPDARIIDVTIDGESLGVPLRILDQHEVVNTTVGKTPVAVTYCPLCDSAGVFSRALAADADSSAGAEPVVLEFGVSGALFNSNVLMYDRTDRGLWSQLGMRAVSGPHTGRQLTTLPFAVVSLKEFTALHPDGKLVGTNTGHGRDYSRAPYEQYFQTDRLAVPLKSMGDVLPRKTLGIGIVAGEQSWFVPMDSIVDLLNVDTLAGNVQLQRTEGGAHAISLPEGVGVVQTFYYSWSAFYPETKIIGQD